jgi:hypothetical protein
VENYIFSSVVVSVVFSTCVLFADRCVEFEQTPSDLQVMKGRLPFAKVK